MDETGVVSVPPPVPDSTPMYLAIAATAAALVAASVYEKRRNDTRRY
jgi:hypothetical protein